MNISTRLLTLLALFLAVLLPGSAARAQGESNFTKLVVVQGDTLTYSFHSDNIVTVKQQPDGWYQITPPAGNVVLKYSSSTLGKDFMTIEYFKNGVTGYPDYLELEIHVVKSIITCTTDYVNTLEDQSILIDVLDNDETTDQGLYLKPTIAFVSNGTAEVTPDNKIDFTPNPGFIGLASISYIASDDQGTCAVGFASVNVTDGNFPDGDTIKYITRAGRSVNIFIDPYTNADSVIAAPQNGALDEIGSVIKKYTPNTGFTGTDFFTLRRVINGENYERVVQVKVLGVTPQNKYAFNDYIYTTKNTAVTFDVLANDLGIYQLWNPQSYSVSKGTLSYNQQTKKFTYTPESNYEGTVSFTYRIKHPMSPSWIESAKCYITISNFKPTLAEYNLKTLEATPLVVQYKIPVSNFSFSIQEEAEYGDVTYYSGLQTITLSNGQQVTGTNMVVYEPDYGFYNDWDEFQIQYCVGNDCKLVKIKVFVEEDLNIDDNNCAVECVWAGDTNEDGVVNMKDLMPIGRNMGVDGEERENASLDWMPQFADNWNNLYQSVSMDLKYVDANGDGIISVDDTSAISQSYNLTHNVSNPASLQLTDAQLYLLPRNQNPPPGVPQIFDVYFGSNANPVYQAHGFTFSMVLNETKELAGYYFYTDSWLASNVPIMSMHKQVGTTRHDFGVSRTIPETNSGHGPVGYVIIQDQSGIRTGGNGEYLLIDMLEAGYENEDGKYFDMPVKDIYASSQQLTSDQVVDKFLEVFPNPASQVLNLVLSDRFAIQQVQVFDLSGKLQLQENQLHTQFHQLNVGSLEPGLYVARIVTEGGVLTRKVEVLR